MARPDIQFDRGHLPAYGDFRLNFEFVYFVTSPDYNLYMDNQQAVYLDVFSSFEREGIEFAFPMQTLFVNRQNSMEQAL